MTAALEVLRRPVSTDHAASSKFRPIGFFVGLIGMIAALVAMIGNFVAAGDIGDGTSTRETLAWTFGLNIAGFGTIKLGIATILMGVLLRAWHRVESAKAALPRLRATGSAGAPASYGDIDTPSGTAFTSATAPGPLPINRIAPKLWAPMVVMGVMGLGVGLVLAFVRSGKSDTADFNRMRQIVTTGS